MKEVDKIDVEYVYVSIRYFLFFFFLSSRLACVKCPVYHVLLAVTTPSLNHQTCLTRPEYDQVTWGWIPHEGSDLLQAPELGEQQGP